MNYITTNEIASYREKLDYIVDTAECYIDPTPNHPRGCARKAWISQAKYWIDTLETITVGNDKGFDRDTTTLMFMDLFISSYSGLLKRLGIKE